MEVKNDAKMNYNQCLHCLCVRLYSVERGVRYSWLLYCPKILGRGSLCGKSCVDDIAEIFLWEGGDVEQWLEPRNISYCLYAYPFYIFFDNSFTYRTWLARVNEDGDILFYPIYCICITFIEDNALDRCGELIGVHFCIIFYFHIMLYVNKNEIFIAFLSKFTGPPLMEMKAHN